MCKHIRYIIIYKVKSRKADNKFQRLLRVSCRWALQTYVWLDANLLTFVFPPPKQLKKNDYDGKQLLCMTYKNFTRRVPFYISWDKFYTYVYTAFNGANITPDHVNTLLTGMPILFSHCRATLFHTKWHNVNMYRNAWTTPIQSIINLLFFLRIKHVAEWKFEYNRK